VWRDSDGLAEEANGSRRFRRHPEHGVLGFLRARAVEISEVNQRCGHVALGCDVIEHGLEQCLRLSEWPVIIPHNADQSNLAAQPRREDFTSEKIVSSHIMRAEGASMKGKNDLADKIKPRMFNVDAKTIKRSQARLEKIGWLSRPQRRGKTNALSLNYQNIPAERMLRLKITPDAQQIRKCQRKYTVDRLSPTASNSDRSKTSGNSSPEP
jgi:hypothetical protein